MRQQPDEQLIERRRELRRALQQEKQTPGTLTADERTWLEWEASHYEKHPNNDLASWAAAKARITAANERLAAFEAERQAKRDEAAKAGAAKAAEIDEKIKAKLAAEVDPVTLYKRRVAQRTF